MPNVFDGTNPITDILGDEPTEREVTMENQSTMTIIEPLTNTQIPAGQTVLVRVIGDMAHSTLVNNIQQINALQGFEVIGLTSVVIPDEPVAGDLLLVPTGAVESADGDYQRFVYDGVNTIDLEIEGETYQFPIWYADLPLANRQSEYQISLKMPDLPDGKEARLLIGDLSVAEAAFGASGFNHIALALRGGGNGGQPTGIPRANLSLKIANDQEGSTFLLMLPKPTVGSIITLTLTTTALDYSWDGGSDSITLPVGFFATAPNLLAYSSSAAALVSDVMPLSIKVAEAPQQ